MGSPPLQPGGRGNMPAAFPPDSSGPQPGTGGQGPLAHLSLSSPSVLKKPARQSPREVGGRAWHADGSGRRQEGPGGSRRGHCPGPRSPSYRPGGQHPTSEQEKSHTHRTSHHSRAPLSTGAAGPTATPKPGDGGSESGAQTCPPGATATAAGKWLAPERGRVGEKVLRATVRGSGSQGLSPQEPLLGEDLRGPLGSWQGEGTSLLHLAPELPPRPPVPRCLWAAGAPSARGSPTPPRAPRGGSQAGGPSLGPVPWASPRGCRSVSGHGGPLLRFRGPRAGAGSICRSARVTRGGRGK